jgi:hypothetical protein
LALLVCPLLYSSTPVLDLAISEDTIKNELITRSLAGRVPRVGGRRSGILYAGSAYTGQGAGSTL